MVSDGSREGGISPGWLFSTLNHICDQSIHQVLPNPTGVCWCASMQTMNRFDHFNTRSARLGSFVNSAGFKEVQQPQVPQLGLVTPHSYSEGDHGLGVVSGLLRKRLPRPLDPQRIKLQKGDPYEGCAKGCFISSFMHACKWHVAIMHLCHSFHWFHPSVCCFQCGWHNRGNTANQARAPLVSAMQRNWIFPRPRDLCQSDSASHTSRVTFVSVSLSVIEILCKNNV